MGELSVFYRGLFVCTYFSVDVEFSKNANSATTVESHPHIVVFVWRQLGFAFFGAYNFDCTHFLFFTEREYITIWRLKNA